MQQELITESCICYIQQNELNYFDEEMLIDFNKQGHN